MNKCYVLTAGEYSDYRIVGVFSTRENVECMAKTIPFTEIEEYGLDPGISELNQGLLPFWVIGMKRDGTSTIRREEYSLEPFKPLQLDREKWPGGGIVLTGNVWATDEHHAAKIANEKRVQLIASGEWGVARESQ